MGVVVGEDFILPIGVVWLVYPTWVYPVSAVGAIGFAMVIGVLPILSTSSTSPILEPGSMHRMEMVYAQHQHSPPTHG